jgi:hypothetical protein
MEINISNVPVIYITSEGNESREARLLDSLKQIGTKEIMRIQGYNGKDLGKGPAWGNAYSQSIALELAAKIRGPVLILEDDCVVSDWFEDSIGFPDSADAVYLGNASFGVESYNPSDKLTYIPGPVAWEPFAEKTVKLNSMMSTHAILYISESFKKAAKRFCQFSIDNESVNLDVYFATGMNFYDVYALVHPAFIQTSQYQMSNAILQ